MERQYPPGWIVGILLLTSTLIFGCSGSRSAPTRTPVSTWTPTPAGQVAQNETPVAGQTPTVDPALSIPPTLVPTSTSTPAPATPTSPPTDTPTITPTPVATDTPTETPVPSPTPTIAYAFQLEAAEKFPTESLAANVVRIYLYVYSPTELGLAGYSLNVVHNGTPLTVDEISVAGLPEQTRTEPSPYTRFTNMNVLFVEPQTGTWEVQLVDQKRAPVGPAAKFELTADERTRELYVRYKQK
ncbi:MAG: hypothetical protein NT075_07980 [Chloroflexi bacterium]|nr:hypothetical protein [Chloroflexota bacterium]